jgi:hypothetical protein
MRRESEPENALSRHVVQYASQYETTPAGTRSLVYESLRRLLGLERSTHSGCRALFARMCGGVSRVRGQGGQGADARQDECGSGVVAKLCPTPHNSMHQIEE